MVVGLSPSTLQQSKGGQVCCIINSCMGKQKRAPNRAFAIYACHYYSNATHQNIADYFGLTHSGSISYPIAKIKKEINAGQWQGMIRKIEKKLFIIQ